MERQLGLGLDPSPVGEPRQSGDGRVNVLYIDGAARSGSTILARLVGAQPRCMTVGEIVLIWRFGIVFNGKCSCGKKFLDCPFWQKVSDCAPGLFDRQVAQRYADFTVQAVLMSRHAPRLWTAKGRRELVASVPKGFLDDTARLYQAVRTVSGAEVIVDASKFAAYRFLLGLVPEVKVTAVHLTRDPRAVAYSWQRKVSGSEQTQTDLSLRFYDRSSVTAALDWMLQNYSTDVVSGLDGYSSYRLRYEDFVARPSETIRELVNLVDPSEQRDDPVMELPVSHIFGNPGRFQIGPLPIKLDDAWRREMPKPSRSLVTAVTSPLVSRYGYSLRTR
jgi:Sulfotransferase family